MGAVVAITVGMVPPTIRNPPRIHRKKSVSLSLLMVPLFYGAAMLATNIIEFLRYLKLGHLGREAPEVTSGDDATLATRFVGVGRDLAGWQRKIKDLKS